MLAKIVHQITQITDDDRINLENYMEGLNFINNIYTFVNKIKMVVPTNDIEFLPTFKGRMTCEKFNISSNNEENEMRYFRTISALFLEDKDDKKEQIRELIGPLCESIDFDGQIITFILR